MIEARDLRVDESGTPCIDGLSFSSKADRLLVLGGPRELMRACAGLSPVVRGELTIDGKGPSALLADGALSSAALDDPLPPVMTPAAYCGFSAELAGLSQAQAADVAAENLARVGVTLAQAKTPMKRQSALIRRATQLAAALAPERAILLLWDPLADLDPDAADVFGRTLGAVLSARRSIVFAGRVPPFGPLAAAMEEVIVLSHSKVVAQGTIADVATRDRAFLVRALGDIGRFEQELTRRGARVARARGVGGAGSTDELAIELGSMENAEVFRAAVATGAIVVEMRPALAAVLS